MPTSVLPFDLFVFVFFPTPVFLYKHAFLFHILSSTLTSIIVDIQLQSPTLRVMALADFDRLTRSLTASSCLKETFTLANVACIHYRFQVSTCA